MRSGRFAAVAAVAALALAACAPPTATNNDSGNEAEQTDGTLRVWLFSEVNQEPKSKVVDAAVEEFEAAHEGTEVDVQYIPVDSRAERFRAAFNDPSSAPDVAEFGNTDLASYVEAGGFADVDDMYADWPEAEGFDPTILESVKVDGTSYGVPWFVGVRSLYYRTDLFEEAGLEPPKTLDELETTARTLRAENPDVLGMAVGGRSMFSAMPYLWAHGGDLAVENGGEFESALDTEESKAGIEAYAALLEDDICPPRTCAQFGGNDSVQQFIAGKAAMTLGGDFNYNAVAESDVKDDFGVVPLPGTTEGSVAPAFAGGNNLGIFASTERQTLAEDFVKLLASEKYQLEMFNAMGNLPTLSAVQDQVADDNDYLKPFIDPLGAGTKFVPLSPAWATIDAQGIYSTMYQNIATGDADVDTASSDAADAMNEAFDAAR